MEKIKIRLLLNIFFHRILRQIGYKYQKVDVIRNPNNVTKFFTVKDALVRLPSKDKVKFVLNYINIDLFHSKYSDCIQRKPKK